MNRPEAGQTLYPGEDATTEEQAATGETATVPLGGEAALWLAEELGGLRERVVALEAEGGRNRGVLVLRGLCALVGAVAALLGVGLVLLTAGTTGLEGWSLAVGVLFAGGVCALPSLVALGLEDELVEITRLALAAWSARSKAPVVVTAAPPWGQPGPPAGWRGP